MSSKVACIQLNSNQHIAENIDKIDFWVGKAAAAGAELVLIPENAACMPATQGDSKKIAEPLDNSGAVMTALSQVAQKHAVWLLVGAFPTLDNGLVYQTLLVYNPSGELAEYYHKRHLFDVTLPDKKESYRESDAFTHGDAVKTVDTPVGRIGLAVCYDLRFPEHFRALLDRGAEILVLPAAFTYNTGKAHWKALLRSRAIENQCYLLASGQTGKHAGGRETWGHSMIIDPWGKVLAKLAQGEGYIIAEIDRHLQRQQRQVFPALQHRRSAS